MVHHIIKTIFNIIIDIWFVLFAIYGMFLFSWNISKEGRINNIFPLVLAISLLIPLIKGFFQGKHAIAQLEESIKPKKKENFSFYEIK